MLRNTMRIIAFLLFVIASSFAKAENFACPDGQTDVMKYFVMGKEKRANHFLNGKPNPAYTQVFPNQDFGPTGYWFWLKNPYAHGFDVKAFDEQYIYMRSTELEWKDNRTFKRFVHDLPIAGRCVAKGEPGPEIKVEDTSFRYFSSCRPYKTSKVRKAVNDLDAPVEMDAGGNLGRVWTRVLHYHYDCDKDFDHCRDEEQFFLANGYGLWQWRHYKEGSLAKTALMNQVDTGHAVATLGCSESFE